MRWRTTLAATSLVFLTLACDGQPVEPETSTQPNVDPSFGATSTLTLDWQETFDQPYAGSSRVTPSGILHLSEVDNGFFVTGDVVGYSHAYGGARVDTRTGQGNGSGTLHYDLTEPGVGALDCTWHSKLYNFPGPFVQYSEMVCHGSGYFDGWKMKVSGNNEANPGVGIYTATAEVKLPD